MLIDKKESPGSWEPGLSYVIKSVLDFLSVSIDN